MSVSIAVQVGATTLNVSGSDFEETLTLAGLVRQEVGRSMPQDAFLRARSGEDFTFLEAYSPGLKASKKLSQYTAANAKNKKFPYYIGINTPWVHVKFVEGDDPEYYVMFDYVDATLIKVGFKEPLAWYKANRDGKKETNYFLPVEPLAYVYRNSSAVSGYTKCEKDHKFRQQQLEYRTKE